MFFRLKYTISTIINKPIKIVIIISPHFPNKLNKEKGK